MNKVSIFSNAQAEMAHIIAGMTQENYQTTRDNLQRYFDFLDALHNLPDVQITGDVTNADEKVQSTHTSDTSGESTKSSTAPAVSGNGFSGEVESLPDDVYILSRELLGGDLIAPGREKVHIPEKFIRRNEWDHGDLIRAVPIEGNVVDGKQMYDYTLVSSENRELLETRIEYKYSFVEYRLGKFFVTKFIHEKDCEIVELENPFEVWDTDIEKHDLEDGDCVAMAYWDTDPESCRVVWKHDSTKRYEKIVHGYKRPVRKFKGITDEERHAKYNFPNLVGKKVVVVNGVIRPEYENILKFIGADCALLTGDEPHSTMESVFKSADVVVCVVTRGSHDASWTTSSLCKAHGVPCNFTHVGGLTTVLRCASEALDKATAPVSA